MGIVLRIIWFLVIGWFLGLVWLGLSIAIMATVIGLPLGAYMATKTWQIATFKRRPRAVYVDARRQQR